MPQELPPISADDVTTRTPVIAPRRPEGQGDAYLVHIYPPGPTMGHRYKLDGPLLIGRGEDCQIRIEDFSVSRRHATIAPRPDGYQLTDMGSTNGSFVNDQPVQSTTLVDGAYIRIGKWIFRFLAGGNVESEYHEEIYRLAIIDGLTQTHNRRYLIEFLDRELARSARHGRPLSVVMFDIDKFKVINDDHGHLAGDYTLREIVRLVQQQLSSDDLLARYGGEEFACVLVESTPTQAMLFAEKLRQAVAAHPFTYEDRCFPVTISLGVAGTLGGETIAPLEILKRADDRMYQAKNTGRNRVVGG
jgi:diguanylate cyclase (GGDEF)-like protein